MEMIVLIVFGVVSLVMDLLYTLLNKTKGYKSLLIRGFTVLAALALAIVCTNLNAVTSALPLLTFMGMGAALLSEAMSVSDFDSEKPKMLTFGILRGISVGLFAVGALTFGSFNVIALACGIALGLGVGFVICAIKKYKKGYQYVSTLTAWAAIGLLLCEGVFGVLTSSRFIASILVVVAGVMIAASQIAENLAKEGGKAHYFASLFYSLALTTLAVLIYFY